MQTHERFAASSLGGGIVSLPGGRVFCMGFDALRMYEADGHVAWQRDASGDVVLWAAPTTDSGHVADPCAHVRSPGRLSWSVHVLDPSFQVLTRDAILATVTGPDGNPIVGVVGPGGTLSLSAGFDNGPSIAPNGDLLSRSGATLTRTRPDGSLVWQASLPKNYQSLYPSRDRVLVLAPPLVHVIDAAGAKVTWTPPPATDLFGPTYTTSLGVAPSGAFYMLETAGSATLRVHRVGADGVERWYETFPGSYDPPASFSMNDERLLLPLVGTQRALHVLEP